jgi:hypothetical protein
VEPSYTHRIQALLLMTYGFKELNEQKDTWYWMNIVILLSNTFGLHHCPEKRNNSAIENHLNRRLWWCVYMRNQLLAFGMRRHARVRHKNRIPMLTLSDFECGAMPLQVVECWKDCLMLRDPVQRKQLAGLCIEKCKLTICIAEFMSAQFNTRTVLISPGTRTMLILITKV